MPTFLYKCFGELSEDTFPFPNFHLKLEMMPTLIVLLLMKSEESLSKQTGSTVNAKVGLGFILTIAVAVSQQPLFDVVLSSII